MEWNGKARDHKKSASIGGCSNLKLECVKEKGVEVSNPQAVIDNLVEEFWTETREMVGVVLLNTRCDVIDGEIVSIGSLNLSIMQPREVFRLAIARSADSVILVHNHPSGDPKPSAGDVDVTENIVRAGGIVGIEVRDHIVVGMKGGEKRSFSMKEKGMI